VQDIFLLAKTSRPTMVNNQPLFSENWVLSCQNSSRDLKLNTNLHLVPMLRMSGPMPPIPHYVFVVWTGRNLRVALRYSIKIFWYFNLHSEYKQELCMITAVHMSGSLPLNRFKPTCYKSADKNFVSISTTLNSVQTKE